MISFLYPAYNRADLFATTLQTFVAQERREDVAFEILVLDDGGIDELLGLVQHFAPVLPLRYLRVDVHRLPFPVFQIDGANNASAAINVGIRQAKGERVVLTSPEVMHRLPTNLARLASWPMSETQAVIADVFDETWRDTEFQGWISGGPARRPLHFLAVYPRQALLDMRGFEEAFLQGKGWEDNEFADRWQRRGGSYVFTGPEVIAEHQTHPRFPTGDSDRVNEALYRELCNQGVTEANRGRDWGASDLVVESWP